MPLSAGSKLGPYEIVGPLGAGGMGEVYRARDTKLEREVAIKVLPAAVAQDPERLARFEREAKVLASLNHPNIAQIYGIEESSSDRALVMELVPGQTLPTPIPQEEALRIAVQIAEALEAAHDKGIIHRDLKPANIMVTPQGVAKVLDFGLAAVPPRSAASHDASHDAANSPTLTLQATQVGVIMGTAGYMSPEQAAGLAVDKRADIWSFGVVLWEMLAGQRLFAGVTVAHILADVLRAPIDLQKLPRETPRAVRELLHRCLDRDVRTRLRDIGEARVAIQNLGKEPEPSPIAASAPQARLPLFAAAMAAALFALVAAALAMVHFREKAPAALPVRFQIPTPERGVVNALSLSPDGRHLAFLVLGPNEPPRIWVRSLDALEAHPLPATEGTLSVPVWSPDSRYIAFGIQGRLKKVEASGGPAQTVSDFPVPMAGAAWAPGGTILFATAGQLMRVPETGGVPTPLAPLGATSDRMAHPFFLPDGRHFLFVLGSRTKNAIYLGSLDDKPGQPKPKLLLNLDSRVAPVYAPSPDPALGYVLFEREGVALALPFDVRRLEPAGPAVPIAEGVSANAPGSLSASSTGVLAFHAGPSTEIETRLMWFDRQGKPLGQAGQPATYGGVQLSRDGRLVVVDRTFRGGSHVWAGDPARGVFNRVNPGDATEMSGQVSPDGRVAFTYEFGGASGDIYLRPASGAGSPELLVKSATVKHPSDWSADGRFLLYDDHTTQKMDLMFVPLTGAAPGAAADRKPVPFLATPANETDAVFSPDTRWVAYSSDESGHYEVYVQGFVPGNVPAAGIGKWQISSAGGNKPYWRHDGKELYYIAGDRKMMAVPIKSTGVQSSATAFEPGVAVPLFDTPRTKGYAPYAVSPDGRFLINVVTEQSAGSSPITVVLNWTAGLKK